MKNPRLLSAVLLLLGSLALPVGGEGAIIYRSNEGWTIEGDSGNKIERNGAEQMRKAETLEAAGKSKAAYAAYRVVVKQYSQSLFAPKAQRKIGALLEANGEYDKAFEAFNTYLTQYPRGDDFDAVVESMFKIGRMFLEGSLKKKTFGVSLGGSVERARTMFETIVKRAPFSRWAPLAQFNIGQTYEKEGKFPEAILSYQTCVARYPADPVADDAQYQIGYVRLVDFREGSYDRASAQKAREAFEDFIGRYPDSEKIPQARENMKQLEGGQVKGSLEIAKFYEKTKQYKAAVIYYNDVIKQQPDSSESTLAKERIEDLKQRLGEDALRAGPERAETGARAQARRKLQARVDTVSRPDYVGPPVNVPEPPVETAPSRPTLRTTPGRVDPVPPLEPPLPSSEPGLNPLSDEPAGAAGRLPAKPSP